MSTPSQPNNLSPTTAIQIKKVRIGWTVDGYWTPTKRLRLRRMMKTLKSEPGRPVRTPG